MNYSNPLKATYLGQCLGPTKEVQQELFYKHQIVCLITIVILSSVQ